MSFTDQQVVDARVGAEVTDTRAVFGQVMGLVALTVAFSAGGAYLGRDFSSGGGWITFAGAIICIIGVNVAVKRSEQLAMAFLFGLGLFIGMSVGPLLNFYAQTDPQALYYSAGSTALFVGGLGAVGYATKRDLSSWARVLFIALIALIVFGIVTLFVAIPGGQLIYAVLGLVVFAGFTIFDFNRLRRTQSGGAIPIAASIFLDIFNVFLFFLQIFGGGSRR